MAERTGAVLSSTETDFALSAETSDPLLSSPAEVPSAFLEVLAPVPLSIQLAQAIDRATESNEPTDYLLKISKEKPQSPQDAAALAIMSVTDEMAQRAANIELARSLLKKAMKTNPDPVLTIVETALIGAMESMREGITENQAVAASGNIKWDRQNNGGRHVVLSAHPFTESKSRQKYLMRSAVLIDAGVNMGVVNKIASRITNTTR